MNNIPIFFDDKNINNRKKNLYCKIKEEEEEKLNQKILKNRAKKEMIIIKPAFEKRNEKQNEPVKSTSITDELHEYLNNINNNN